MPHLGHLRIYNKCVGIIVSKANYDLHHHPIFVQAHNAKGDIMEFQVLLNKLEKINYRPLIFGNQDNNCDMLNIRILTEGQSHFEETILYLTSTGLMPDSGSGHPFILFCYGKEIDFSLYRESSFTIVYFGADISQA